MLCAIVISTVIGCAARSPRKQVVFSGRIFQGQEFSRNFGGRYVFQLQPHDHGWRIVIREQGGSEDLQRLTPPFHFSPNPTDIQGPHFRNAENTGPNDGTVNAPQYVRDFIFSPEVGKVIQGPSDTDQPSSRDIEHVAGFGQGVLTIEKLMLSLPRKGGQAEILEMSFSCKIAYSK
jgi:hypothetical protein